MFQGCYYYKFAPKIFIYSELIFDLLFCLKNRIKPKTDIFFPYSISIPPPPHTHTHCIFSLGQLDYRKTETTFLEHLIFQQRKLVSLGLYFRVQCSIFH